MNLSKANQETSQEAVRDRLITAYFNFKSGDSKIEKPTNPTDTLAGATAAWMIHGFYHGSLDIDSFVATGEMSYGKAYGFLPYYDPKFSTGEYGFGQQPNYVLNLLKETTSESIEETFSETFAETTLQLFADKIGVKRESEELKNLFYTCLQFLENSQTPYEAFYHDLYMWHQDLRQPLRDYNPELYDDEAIEEIQKLMGAMERSSTAPEKGLQDLVTLSNTEIDAIWAAINKDNNWSLFQKKIAYLERK